jgi:hypothetical protein
MILVWSGSEIRLKGCCRNEADFPTTTREADADRSLAETGCLSAIVDAHEAAQRAARCRAAGLRK